MAASTLPIPTLIADTTCLTGENPLWHLEEGRIYWVDIPAGLIYRAKPGDPYELFFDAQTAVGGFTFEADGSLVLFMAKGAVKHLKNGVLTTIVESIPGAEDSRFNDVIADPEGRVFGGIMPIRETDGSLYRIESGGRYTKVLDGLGIPNGMGFTRDLKTFYFTDSTERVIWQFDYDRGSGEISNQRALVRPAKDISVPDGMTVDGEDRIWSARWDGSHLYRYSAAGAEELKIAFPAKKVSSVVFGGDGYRQAFITTAGGGNRPAEGSGAGALFQIDLGVAGKPEFRSKIAG